MTSDVYEKRPEASNYGREFEYLMCAFYSLKLLYWEKISDFEIYTNHISCGVFDDVVIRMKFPDGSVKLLLLQLKYSNNDARNVKLIDFISNKSNFCLAKYEESYREHIQKHVENNFQRGCPNDKFDICLILYTNKCAAFKDDKKLKLSENCYQIQENTKETDGIENLLNTNIDGKNVYEITCCTSNYSTNFNNFFQRFYIYTNQKNCGDVKIAIHKMLIEKFSCDVGERFINFFEKWSDTNFILSKQYVLEKLSELVFSPSIKTLTEKYCTNSELLKEAIMLFDITVMDSVDICEKIWGQSFSDEKKIFKIIEKYILSDKKISNLEEVTSEQRSKILWYLDESPLIIGVNLSNRKQIQLSISLLAHHGIKKKFLLMGECKEMKLPDNWKILKNLFGLKQENKELYKKIIEEFKISLQGKNIISIENLIGSEEENANSFGMSELFTILSAEEKYCVETEEESLPEHYVPRSVSPILIDTEKLLEKSFLRKNLVIINHVSKFIENLVQRKNIKIIETHEYLQLKTVKMLKDVVICKNKEYTLDQFQEICSKVDGNVYLFKIFDTTPCMLIVSNENQGSVRKLKNFALSESFPVEEAEIHNVFDGPLNCICAEPGMGKSTMMKYLKINAPSDHWTVFIELKAYNSVFKSESSIEDILNKFLKMETSDSFTKKIKKSLLEKRKIIFFFDGLDEIEYNIIDIVIKFIKEISLMGHRVWVSVRQNFEERIENSLNVIPLQIVELNEVQQQKYITTRLKQHYEDDKIEQIIEKILSNAHICNNNKILGIPLQLYIITQILIDNKSPNFKIDEKMFILTNLYEMFFKGNVNHALRKNNLINVDLADRISTSELKRYTIAALQSCLTEKDFEILDFVPHEIKENNELLLWIKEKGDHYGIIKQIDVNGKALFWHQTYAEYFAAIFLSRHYHKVGQMKDRLFSENYSNLKLFLDLELAKEIPLHLGIICRDIELIKKYIGNSKQIKDKANRSALHLVCNYAERYPPFKENEDWFVLRKEDSSFQDIIIKLIQLHDVMEKDELFKWSAVEYATFSYCLFPIEIMLENGCKEIMKKVLEFCDERTLLYYSARLGYPYLLMAVLKIKQICKKEKFGKNKLSILHVAVKENDENITKWLPQLLLFNKAEIDEEDLQKRTPLHYAVENGNESVVDLLISKGADVSCVAKNGRTVLHEAAANGNCDLIRFLLNKGIDVNKKDVDGKTALYLVAEHGNEEMAKLLIENGADVKVITNNNETVLHGACKKGNCELVKYLLNNGVNPNVKNVDGETALDLAEEYGNKNVAMLLV